MVRIVQSIVIQYALPYSRLKAVFALFGPLVINGPPCSHFLYELLKQPPNWTSCILVSLPAIHLPYLGNFGSQMSPKPHVLKGWSPVCDIIKKWWSLEDVELNGRKLGHQDMPLMGILEPSPFLFFRLFFLASFYRLLSPWCPVPPQTQSKRLKWPWTKTSETMSQKKSFLLLSLLC